MVYQRLRELREDRDITQQKLADYLKCAQSTYSLYELGKHDIPTQALSKLADFYGVSTDYLLGRTDVPAPYPPGRHRS